MCLSEPPASCCLCNAGGDLKHAEGEKEERGCACRRAQGNLFRRQDGEQQDVVATRGETERAYAICLLTASLARLAPRTAEKRARHRHLPLRRERDRVCPSLSTLCRLSKDRCFQLLGIHLRRLCWALARCLTRQLLLTCVFHRVQLGSHGNRGHADTQTHTHGSVTQSGTQRKKEERRRAAVIMLAT